MTDKIKIGERLAGEGYPTYVIAEIGINHNGDFSLAKKLIEQARYSGADAVKFQTYITEKRVGKNSPIFEILKKCELSFDVQKQLFVYAATIGIEAFSTPFDGESVDFLSSINVPCYKVASFDLVNKELLKKIVSQGKPVIMSRGMADQHEIDEAVSIAKRAAVPCAILHCISAYPVNSLSILNLRTIRALKERYSCPVGFSDHTLGIGVPPYAVAAGASIIEKHFTISRISEGPDHALSVEPEELKEMVISIRKVEEMMGDIRLSAVPEEKDILQYRRMS